MFSKKPDSNLSPTSSHFQPVYDSNVLHHKEKLIRICVVSIHFKIILITLYLPAQTFLSYLIDFIGISHIVD